MTLMRESFIVRGKKAKQKKRAVWSYRPENEGIKEPKTTYRFANSSGNEVHNIKNIRITDVELIKTEERTKNRKEGKEKAREERKEGTEERKEWEAKRGGSKKERKRERREGRKKGKKGNEETELEGKTEGRDD